MSLAADILRQQSTISPPAPKHAKPRNYIELAEAPKKTRPYFKPKSEMIERPRVKGTSWIASERRWQAYFYDGTKQYFLGKFVNQQRARLAVRLFKLWRTRGMTDIPNKPERRPYNKIA